MDKTWRGSIHLRIAASVRDICEHSRDDVASRLEELTATAVDNVPGAQYAGITMSDRKGHVETATATGWYPRLLDDVQKRHQQGPCLQAALDGLVVSVDDLRTDSRWPDFQRDALAEAPTRSILSIPIATTYRTTGSLNFYAEKPHAFGPESCELAVIWAAHTTQAWDALLRDNQLRAAVASRDIIGQAKGMLMERYRIDAAAAFDMLRELSQKTNTPVREVSRKIVQAEHLSPE